MTGDHLKIEVLAAGYSFHTKSYHDVQRDGLKSYLIRLQTEGQALALVENRLEVVSPGDLLIYAPGDPYELKTSPFATGPLSQSGSGDYYIFCRGEWLDQWWQQKRILESINISLLEGILAVWRLLITEKRRVRDEVNEISKHLLCSLCLLLDRAITNSTEQTRPGATVAYQVKYFIEQNATTPFNLEDVARQVGLSVSRVVHLFKSTFNQTIMEYTIEIRLAIASEHIRLTNMPLEQVAEVSGFRNYSYFSRLFRTRYKVSPRQYRLEHQLLSLV